MMNVLDTYNFNPTSIQDQNIVTTYQRIAETFKHAYGIRTQVGDEDFEDMTRVLFNVN